MEAYATVTNAYTMILDNLGFTTLTTSNNWWVSNYWTNFGLLIQNSVYVAVMFPVLT